MGVVVITPAAAFVTLAEAKLHCNVDHDDDDTLIEAYIAAATAHIDGPFGWLGRSVGEQTLEYTASGFGCERYVQLPYPPVISVTSVKYLDSDGVEQTVAPADYSVIGDTFWLLPDGSWPSVGYYPDAVRVRYQAGYETVPESIRVAVLLHVGTLYDNRASIGEAQSILPHAYAALLSTFRVY